MWNAIRICLGLAGPSTDVEVRRPLIPNPVPVVAVSEPPLNREELIEPNREALIQLFKSANSWDELPKFRKICVNIFDQFEAYQDDEEVIEAALSAIASVHWNRLTPMYRDEFNKNGLAFWKVLERHFNNPSILNNAMTLLWLVFCKGSNQVSIAMRDSIRDWLRETNYSIFSSLARLSQDEQSKVSDNVLSKLKRLIESENFPEILDGIRPYIPRILEELNRIALQAKSKNGQELEGAAMAIRLRVTILYYISRSEDRCRLIASANGTEVIENVAREARNFLHRLSQWEQSRLDQGIGITNIAEFVNKETLSRLGSIFNRINEFNSAAATAQTPVRHILEGATAGQLIPLGPVPYCPDSGAVVC